MATQDTLSLFFTQLRNSLIHKKLIANCYKTNINIKILELLYQNGFIKGYFIRSNSITVFLKYNTRTIHVFSTIKRISKPSYRKYITYELLKTKTNEDKSYPGLLILSTTSGICSHKYALKKRIGGEILCEII